MKLGATFLVRDRAGDEAKVVVDTAFKFLKGGDRVTIAATPKGAVQADKFGRTVWVSRGQVVVLTYLGAEHWEALGKGIAGTDANTCIHITSQATPASLGVRKERREGVRGGSEAGVVGAKVLLGG